MTINITPQELTELIRRIMYDVNPTITVSDLPAPTWEAIRGPLKRAAVRVNFDREVESG